MKTTKATLVTIALLFMVATLTASGPVGIYGIIEKVVFEPNEQAPERIQVWGAFAYVDGAGLGLNITEVKRGYLYFERYAPPFAGPNNGLPVELKEWNDLKGVAGTGQAVAFGRWAYIGTFQSIQPEKDSRIFPRRGGASADLRVRAASEPPSRPGVYETNSGVVKLSEQGSHAEVVKQLKAALKR